MITMQLSEAARVLGAAVRGNDVAFAGVSTDTRTIAPGQLFFALKGPRFDAQTFLTQAAERGASAAVVSEATEVLPSIVVSDTRPALGVLSRHWLEQLGTPMIAITGSNGKTTVKEMVAAILSQCGPTLATQGNLNNDIGVPLNLFRLSPEHRFAVIEMGANRPGDIAQLTEIAPPDVSVITLCAPAHLEGFGSIEGVAKTKGEIFQGLKENGVAAINADDPYAVFWRGLAGKRRVIDFGFTPGAAVTVAADSLAVNADGSRFQLTCAAGSAEIALKLAGRHNVMNALAAAACACALDIPIAAIREGLRTVQPVKGRLQTYAGLRGCRVIDDSYNANPSSLHSAIEVLKQYPGRRWLVFGDMGELGPGAAGYHREVGVWAQAAGIDGFFATGELAREAVSGYGAGAAHFADAEILSGALRDMVAADVTVLVKGSRSMRMERVVQALMGKD